MIEQLVIISMLLVLIAAGFAILYQISCVATIAHFSTKACCFNRLFVVGVHIIYIVIARDILISEVEHQCRIERHATQSCLEVQVRTCASSCVSAQTNHFSGFN